MLVKIDGKTYEVHETHELCAYCGQLKGWRLGCCGEVHYITGYTIFNENADELIVAEGDDGFEGVIYE